MDCKLPDDNAMKTTIPTLLKTALLALLVTGPSALAQSFSWSVNILPPGSSVINWSTTSPPASGTFTKSGKITFNKWSYITFQVTENSGFKLTHFFKQAEDQLPWNPSARSFSFGPVNESEPVIAVCELINPTGTFAGNYTDAKALTGNLTAIADVTGNYNGTATVKNTSRTYNADVAMDDSGKLSAMGTATGVANKDGGPVFSGSAGSVKTVDNTPYADLKGSFKGSVDNKPTTATGAGSGDLVFKTSGNGTQIGGVASGSSVVGGNKTVLKPTEKTVAVPPADVAKLKKSWGLTLSIVEVPATTKVKSYVTATGVLRLTSGESSVFLPAKKVTYSAKTGYLVSFASGYKKDVTGAYVYVKIPKTNINKLDVKGNPIHVLDKKSTVKISKMLLNKSGTVWVPASGLMEYSFLGQKGKGDLKAFLD